MLELIALGTDHDRANEVAQRLGGIAYVNHESESDRRPYSTLVRVSTDDIAAVQSVADVALHVGFSRVIKPLVGEPPAERVVAAFGLRRRPDLSHTETDTHWRDTHGPLALVNHAAMCDYIQLSIVGTLDGPELDGIALCCFPTRDDMRNKFFNDDAAKAVIEADVAKFANPQGSPRRVVLTQSV